VLQDIATGCGIAGWPAQANEAEVAALEESFRSLGISAVPTFVIDRRFGVSGAQPPEALAEALREGAATAPSSR
jgi:predicted DsbA family dithiol-disulfide isomerase